MDPSPRSFPILSYVMSRIPSFGPAQPASDSEFDIEQPSPGASSSSSSAGVPPGILDQMPHLKDPKVLAAMRHAVADVAQTRSVLNALGPRPDHESVDRARAKLAEIESSLSKSLEDLVLTPRASDVERLEWRAHLADKEERIRKEAEKERSIYKAVLQLDEMHQSYGKLLKEAEQRLARIYDSAEEGDVLEGGEIVNEEVVGVLEEALGKGLERMDLSGRKLKFLPEAFGKIKGLIVLDLSNNQLEVIPDSIAGLISLEEFNISSNLLESLPDSIGLLQKMKILNVSGNKLGTLPDSICQCRSLVELNASFNSLTYLPTNIGSGLVNLERLSVELNKISSFPTSIGHMVFLRYLDAHFNELCGLPDSIGGLTNLEVLNLSSNFNDLTELPETFGELTNLKELDLSNNQIHALPDTFGRLDNLVKLNLEQNPLVVPPKEIVDQGFEAVKTYMAKRWLDVLLEEEKKSMIEENEEAQSRWLTRSTSWLKNNSITLVRTLSGKMVVGGGSPRDPYLEEQR